MVDELKNVASEPEQGSKRLRLLCAAILREITPTSQLVIASLDPPIEQRCIPIILPLSWVQVGVVVLLLLINWCFDLCHFFTASLDCFTEVLEDLEVFVSFFFVVVSFI